MQKEVGHIAIFLVIVSALILLLVAFIILMLYLYKKRQIVFVHNLEQIKLDHERNILAAQLEIQEQTFQHISREIHDNVSLSLTLAKLQLNTLEWGDSKKTMNMVESSIELLSRSIHDLSNISKSLDADAIIQQGLLSVLETEIKRISSTGLLTIGFEVSGSPVYLSTHKELIIFRIIQEAINNIIKHAGTKNASINLHYNSTHLHIGICDNGTGFDYADYLSKKKNNNKAGLKNMETRANMIKGRMQLKSQLGGGTSVSFTIPFE